jgi:L-seryl-tRNA(Ser) seleniumtransferase
MLDHDVFAPLWKPRGRLFQDLHLPTLPDHGSGRPAKVGKEQVIGLLAALERYQMQDEVLVSGEWRTTCEQIISAFGTAAKVAVAITDDSRRKGAYFVEVVLDEIALGLSALDVAERLQEGEPSIRVNLSRAREGILLLSPMCLRQDEAAILGEALSKAVQ